MPDEDGPEIVWDLLTKHYCVKAPKIDNDTRIAIEAQIPVTKAWFENLRREAERAAGFPAAQ